MKYMPALNALALALGLSGCGGDKPPESPVSEVQWDIPPRYKDSGVSEALAEAQASLPQFLELLANPPTGSSEFRVLVKKPSGKPQYVDHFVWVEDISPVGTGYTGTIEKNADDIARTARSGRKLSFTPEEIYDWSFIGSDGIYGNYVMRAELENASSGPDTLTALKSRFRELSDLPE